MQLTDLTLHQKSHMVTLTFTDGTQHGLPCEYLRVYSPSAERRTLTTPFPVKKKDVNIIGITPIGHYAVKFVFDDGHDTGIYSWDTLYQLAVHYPQNWQRYLDEMGESRDV